MPINDHAGHSNVGSGVDTPESTPPSRSLPKEQQRRHLQQQKKPSERMRQLVLQNRTDQLSQREYNLVTHLREALFERHKNMKKMFEKVDLNDDSIVTLEEFLYALEGAGEATGHEIDRARIQLPEEEAARIMSYFDRDGQGVLRYNEFMRLLQGTIEIAGPSNDVRMHNTGSWMGDTAHSGFGGTGRSTHSAQSGRSSPGLNSTADMRDTNIVRERLGLGRGRDDQRRVQDAFRQWDSNGDGLISERELHNVLQSLDPRFKTRDVQKLMKAADQNGDGVIDHQEFVAWLFQ
jgi:Ca2+-binding EF-hand superfamily protein